MKIKINNFLILVYIVLNNSCNTVKSSGYTDTAFKQYLISKNKINLNSEMNDKLYDDYYSEFLKYETKTKLEKNPFIKINQVYSYYSETLAQTFGTIIEEGKQSVTFIIYADDGYFYLNTFDLRSKEFSIPENGKIKLEKPIVIQHFGSYQMTNDFLKTRKHNKSYRQEWTDYLNGTIKNDTIHFTEQYIGQYVKFEKKWWARKKKYSLIEIYQPNLKAVKFKNNSGLPCFEVTGEFNLTR